MRSTELFPPNKVSDEDLRELALRLRPVAAAPGDEIVGANDLGKGVFFIREGRATVSARTQTLVSTVAADDPSVHGGAQGPEGEEENVNVDQQGPGTRASSSRSSPLKKNSGRGGGAVRPGSAATQRLKTRDVPLGELVAPAIFGEECLVPYVYPQELGGGQGPGRHAFTVRAAAAENRIEGGEEGGGSGPVVLRLAPEDMKLLPHVVARRLQQLARSTAAASMGARQGLSVLPNPPETTSTAPAPAPAPVRGSNGGGGGSGGGAASHSRPAVGAEDSVVSLGRRAATEYPSSRRDAAEDDFEFVVERSGPETGATGRLGQPAWGPEFKRAPVGVGLGGGGGRLREVGPLAAQRQAERRSTTLAPLRVSNRTRPASAVDARRPGGGTSTMGLSAMGYGPGGFGLGPRSGPGSVRPSTAGPLGPIRGGGGGGLYPPMGSNNRDSLENVLTIEHSTAGSVYSAWGEAPDVAPSVETSYEYQYHHAAASASAAAAAEEGNMFGRPTRATQNGLKARVRMPRFGEQMTLRPIVNNNGRRVGSGAGAVAETGSSTYASRQNKGPKVRQTKKSLAMAADTAYKRNPLTGYGGNSGARLFSAEVTPSGQPMLGYNQPVVSTAAPGLGGNPWEHGIGPALRTGRPRPASAAPDFGRRGGGGGGGGGGLSGGPGLTRERSVGATRAVPVPVLRAKTVSLQRTLSEAAYNDRYGDNLGGLGDDPSGYFPGQQQQQQQRTVAVVEPGGRVRARRPQSATATMERFPQSRSGTTMIGGSSGGGVGGVRTGTGQTQAQAQQRAAGYGIQEPLRGVFSEVEAPSQTFGAAWGVPDPSDMGLL